MKYEEFLSNLSGENHDLAILTFNDLLSKDPDANIDIVEEKDYSGVYVRWEAGKAFFVFDYYGLSQDIKAQYPEALIIYLYTDNRAYKEDLSRNKHFLDRFILAPEVSRIANENNPIYFVNPNSNKIGTFIKDNEAPPASGDWEPTHYGISFLPNPFYPLMAIKLDLINECSFHPVYGLLTPTAKSVLVARHEIEDLYKKRKALVSKETIKPRTPSQEKIKSNAKPTPSISSPTKPIESKLIKPEEDKKDSISTVALQHSGKPIEYHLRGATKLYGLMDTAPSYDAGIGMVEYYIPRLKGERILNWHIEATNLMITVEEWQAETTLEKHLGAKIPKEKYLPLIPEFYKMRRINLGIK
jgi:hypothetical protein